MTRRLYYDASYMVEFSARIVERLMVDNRPAVILDQTCFYPTGGGQPNDLGTLDGIDVIDVYTREEDGAVVHVLANEVSRDMVEGYLDWTRRFDHMQHHTGQHILTQAFVQVTGANTVGFHLSPDSVTIDLDTAKITPEIVSKAEDTANQIIFENRPVRAYLIDPDKAEHVRIRRMPGQLMTDGLRVIDIERFDITACGGTHVARTGDIGIIKVIKLERRGDKTRVEFRCGGRALRDYREKNAVVSRLSSDLTCGIDEINLAVGRLQDELKQTLRALKAASSQLAEYDAERLLAGAVDRGGLRLVRAAFENRDLNDLRTIASRVTQSPDVVALLGTSSEKAQLVFARSQNVAHDMNTLLKQCLVLLDGARGGGQPGMAQGGGIRANLAQINAALDKAETLLPGPSLAP